MRVRVTPIEHSIMTLLRGAYPRAFGVLEMTRIIKKLEGRPGEYEWSISPRPSTLVDLDLAEEAGVRTIINSNHRPAPMKTWRAKHPFVEIYSVERPNRPSNMPPSAALLELLADMRRETINAIIVAINATPDEDSTTIAEAIYAAIERGQIPHIVIEALTRAQRTRP